MIHAFQKLWSVAGAHLYKLAVDQKERNYPIWVKGVWNFIVSFIKFLQWLKVPLRSFTPNELYIIACVLCCRKIHSWNVKLFLIVASTCGPYKSSPADKIANLAHNNRSLTCAEKAEAGTHMNISVFPFGRLGG